MTDLTPTQEVERALKAPKAFFEWTKTCFNVYQWENKQAKIVSTEDKKRLKTAEITTKRLTLNSNLNKVYTKGPFIYFAVSKKRVEIQSYLVTQFHIDGKEYFDFNITNLERFENNKHTKYHAYKDGKGNIMGFNGLISTTAFSGAYGSFYMYHKKPDLGKCEDLKYLNFDMLQLNNNDLILQLQYLFKYRERIEYAQKIGANKIAREIVGTVGYANNYYSYGLTRPNMAKLTMRFLKTHKSYLKQHDFSFDEVYFRKYVMDQCGYYKEGLLELKSRHTNEKDFIKDLLQIKPSSIGIQKFQNYLVKQGQSIQTYRDYLNLLSLLDVPLTSKSTLLPKNLKEAHDKASERFTFANNAEKQAKYQERFQDLIKLNMEIGDFKFVIPEQLEEIVAEGEHLHHCVGSYTDKVLKGETLIVFIRSKENFNESLYTMEVKNGRVLQIRGRYNSSPEEKARIAAEKFIASAKRKHLLAS